VIADNAIDPPAFAASAPEVKRFATAGAFFERDDAGPMD
jgi:hypothetical protein